MLTAKTLREILKEIFGVDDKHLVALSTDAFMPTVDANDKVGTWIGYRMLNKRRYARAYPEDDTWAVPVKVTFRLVFVGPWAEDLVDSIHLWEERQDVSDAFEKHAAQINYDERMIYTQNVKQGGYNDGPVWVADISAQTTYVIDYDAEIWKGPLVFIGKIYTDKDKSQTQTQV